MRLTDLVDPGHGVVTRLLARTSCDASLPVRQRVEILRKELAGWQLVPRLGARSYGEVEAARAGNCVDLASLFCAGMRRTGHPSKVLIGSWAEAFPAVMHAWAVVHPAPDGGWLLVDPIGMHVRPCQPMELESELAIVALCDEEQVIMSAADRAALWQRGEEVR